MGYSENIKIIDENSGLEIAKGETLGHTHSNKFGKELITGSGVNDVDIVGDGNGIYVPPTTDRTHKVKSDSVQDIGTLRGTYASTTYAIDKLIDTGATFIADGVAVGDVVVDDTTQDHSLVLSIDSETQITIEDWHHDTSSNVGNTFRIAGAGGTGSIFTHISSGIEKDGTQHTEFILMNGTTNVNTLNSYYRITKSHIHGAGANKNNVGKITITADIDTTVTAFIGPNKGQTLMAFIHVPVGKTAYMNSFYVSMFRSTKIADAMADIQLMSNLWGVDAQVIEHSIAVGAAGGLVGKIFNPPKKFTQGTDVWIRSIETTDTNSTISAGFDIIFIDN